jgi:4-carboxymuconolactone decarboxylase
MKWEKRFDWSGTYMSRVELCEQKFKELFRDAKFSTAVTDPDFYDILNHFIFGDVFFKEV